MRQAMEKSIPGNYFYPRVIYLYTFRSHDSRSRQKPAGFLCMLILTAPLIDTRIHFSTSFRG